jgi:hypothetical protein
MVFQQEIRMICFSTEAGGPEKKTSQVLNFSPALQQTGDNKLIKKSGC